MGSPTSSLLSLAGLAVAGYGIYYLYTNGYVKKILDALKLPSGGSSSSGGSDSGGTDTGSTTTPPASTCKSGEYMSTKQKKCVKTPTCKSGETFDESTEKCAKASGGRAQIVSRGYVAAFKGWKPMEHRITLG